MSTTLDTSNMGQYRVRVVLATLLAAWQVQGLVEALQVSYDDGTAGMFEIDSSGATSVVDVYREISDDFEVIQDNLAEGRLLAGDADSLVVAQLALELSEHQDASPYIREIVASLQNPSLAKSMVTGLDPLTFQNVDDTTKPGGSYEYAIRVGGQGILKGDVLSVGVIFGNLTGKNFVNKPAGSEGDYTSYLTYMEDHTSKRLRRGDIVELLNPQGQVLGSSAIGSELQSTEPKSAPAPA